jgi:PAS domain S-box-containing protein
MKEGERFQRAFEDAAIGIALLAVEPLGLYLEVNPTFCRMTGYSRDQLLSRTFQSITAAQDIDRNIEQLQQLLQGNIPSLQLEKRYVRKDGGSFWARLNVSLVRDDGKTPKYFIVQIEDIDEYKRAEEALRNEEKRLLLLVEQIPAVLWTTDTELRFTLSVGAGLASLGLVPNQVVGMTLFEYFQTDDPETLPIQASRRALHGESVTYETVWKDRVFKSYVEPLRGRDGQIIGVIGFALDISDPKRTEEALRQNENRTREAVQVSQTGIFDHDQITDTIYWSPEQRKIYGFGPDEPVTLAEFLNCVHPEDRERIGAAVRRAHDPAGDGRFDVEHRILRRDGAVRWLTTRSQTFFKGEGDARRPFRTIGAVLDITERRRTEEALRDSGRLNEQIIRSAREGIVVHDRDLRYRAWNPYMEEMTGLRAESVLGKNPLETISIQREYGKHILTDENIKEILDSLTRAMAGETVARPDFAVTLKHTGQTCWNSVRYDPLRNAQGDIVGVIVTVRDITERKRAEEALRESSQFNQQVIDNAREGIIVYDRHLRYVVWNPFMEELSGLRAEKVLGKRPRELLTIYKEEQGKLQMEKETVENIEASIKRAMAGETFSYLDIPFLIKQTGMMGWTSVRYGPFRNAQGEIVGVIATVRDVTEQKRLEEQLRHAQKLEAVGQLAGGVAHEFNNMLTAIIGNLDLAIGEIPQGSVQRSTLTAALQAARRAALLTQQLLTLSHRGPMDLQPQHLGAIAQDVVAFMRQTIDRRIQVRVQTPEFLWTVLADALQMHQVIMNLCVNARDSLVESLEGTAPEPAPPGWEPRIVIAAENVRIDEAYCKLHFDARPGEYVCLSVSDNGYGIAEGISHRIFEPFFTTKEVGRGTGLGLATVYGIIKQHEAWIDLFSTKYGETIFKLYLPRTDRPAVPISPSVAPSQGTARGTETILFVDDEAPIRRLGQTILEHHGYTVLLAKDGEEALEVFNREHERIKLVVLDLTMPLLSGREVLKRLLHLDSSIRILISSGHHSPTDSTELQNLGMVQMVPKPYRPDDLARSVRKLLDTPVPPRPVR